MTIDNALTERPHETAKHFESGANADPFEAHLAFPSDHPFGLTDQRSAADAPSPAPWGQATNCDVTKPPALWGTDWHQPVPGDAPKPWWLKTESSTSGSLDEVVPSPMSSRSRNGTTTVAEEEDPFRSAVLQGLSVHGFLTIPQIALLTDIGISDDAVKKRLARLKAKGLVENHVVTGSRVPAVTCWRLAKPGATRNEIGKSTALHHMIANQVAITLRRGGASVTTEGELRREELDHRDAHGYDESAPGQRAWRPRVLPDGQRLDYSGKRPISEWHRAWMPEYRPDLCIRTNADVVGWEIELTPKTRRRLDEKLAWYAASTPYTQVVYLCGNEAVARAVERAARRAAPTLDLLVGVLPSEFVRESISRRRVAQPTTATELLALLRRPSATDPSQLSGVGHGHTVDPT